jgi:steroid delta-isomerase-like uncharacterized protein
MSEELKAIGRQLVEVWNTGNLSIVDEIFASDFVNHDPTRPEVTDIESYKKFIAETRSGMPDFKVVNEDMIAEGDKLVSRYTVSGTFQNDFFGIPATGKKATWTGVNIYHFTSGKIVEAWWHKDSLTMLQQLGVIPTE